MSLQRKAVNRIYVKRNTVCVNANSFCVRNNLTMLSLSESMLRANPEISLYQAYTNQSRPPAKPVVVIMGIMCNFNRMVLWGANGACFDIFLMQMGCNSRKFKGKHSTAINVFHLADQLGTSVFHLSCYLIVFAMR